MARQGKEKTSIKFMSIKFYYLMAKQYSKIYVSICFIYTLEEISIATKTFWLFLFLFWWNANDYNVPSTGGGVGAGRQDLQRFGAGWGGGAFQLVVVRKVGVWGGVPNVGGAASKMISKRQYP